MRTIITRHFGLVGMSGLAAAFLGLLLVAGCSRAPLPHARNAETAATFVSETECAPCHRDLVKSCATANHARTLRAAAPSALGSLAPHDQQIPGTCYSVGSVGDRLRFTSSTGKPTERMMDLAIGSGKSGITFVSLDGNSSLTELRMSWYPNRGTWYLTPGQETDTDNEVGEPNNAAISRSCLGCHATTIPSDSLRPAERFFGVGCQSCHGPASAHLAAAKAGSMMDLHMEHIGAWNATRINNMCGRCHRSGEKVGTAGVEVTMTQRFQPYGLMQSPCFQKSGDRLSCVTCHDPHTNVATNPRVYETACLRCHTAPAISAAGRGPAPNNTGANHACPVNPRSGCVECHMPKRKVFPSSDIPIAMADHLIWAYRKRKNPH